MLHYSRSFQRVTKYTKVDNIPEFLVTVIYGSLFFYQKISIPIYEVDCLKKDVIKNNKLYFHISCYDTYLKSSS